MAKVGACVVKGECVVRGGVWQRTRMTGGVHGGGMCGREGCAWQEGVHGKGGVPAGETATEAGSWHPTGMHSSLRRFLTPFFHFSAFCNLGAERD